MKIKEEVLLQNGLMPFDFRDNSNKVLKAMDDYAKLAIKEDRNNLLEHIEINYTGLYGEKHITIDKDSVLNAPQIELL